MTKETNLQKQKELQEVARGYRDEGYKVIIAPSEQELPEFLQFYNVDMIAYNESENIVIEVRTRSSLTDLPRLDKIAAAVEQQDNWRVDLIVNQQQITYKLGATLDVEDIKYRLQEAHELSDKEHGEAALLLTWSTVEALLRRDAQTEKVPIELQDNPLYLIKSLFTYGLLDREQYQILKSGVDARNTIVHGYKKPQSFAEVLSQLLSLADDLVDSPLPA